MNLTDVIVQPSKKGGKFKKGGSLPAITSLLEFFFQSSQTLVHRTFYTFLEDMHSYFIQAMISGNLN